LFVGKGGLRLLVDECGDGVVDRVVSSGVLEHELIPDVLGSLVFTVAPELGDQATEVNDHLRT